MKKLAIALALSAAMCSPAMASGYKTPANIADMTPLEVKCDGMGQLAAKAAKDRGGSAYNQLHVDMINRAFEGKEDEKKYQAAYYTGYYLGMASVAKSLVYSACMDGKLESMISD